MSRNSANDALPVALVGFGTVGRAVARILCDGSQRRLRLTHICNRNVERKRVDWMPPDVVWTDDIDVVLGSDAAVVVEVIGGLEPATAWIRRALEAGKSVVTANKQVIADSGAQLEALARGRGVHLGFEAAVAGGIPIVSGLRQGLAGDRLLRILAILNGTCNYILTRMEADGARFDAALREAQQLGYAEADPSADVDGFDAQAKLAILSAVGLRRSLVAESIPLGTITTLDAIDFAYARRLGCTIRQVSRAELDAAGGVRAAVRPMLVPQSSALARVSGSGNIIVVKGERGAETAFSGHGAGGDPTAVAVVSDLAAIAAAAAGDGTSLAGGQPARATQEFESAHYIRFLVNDRAGIVAALAGVFARHGLNLDSVLQDPGGRRQQLAFVMTLDPCGTEVAQAALRDAAALDFHAQPPLWMPILA